MRLPFKRRAANDPGDSGALNDLSFLLIVFFIVIAGFNVNKGFLVNLPDSQKPRVVQTDDLMKCSFDPEGKLYLDSMAISISELSEKITDKKARYPNMTFLLTIDESTEWEYVVELIHEIRRLDVENFSFRMASK